MKNRVGMRTIVRKRGIALFLSVVVLGLLLILVATMISRQRLLNRSTLSELRQMERQALIDSSEEWLYASLASSYSFGEKGGTFVYDSLQREGDKVSFHFFHRDEAGEGFLFEKNQSYNNLASKNWARLKMEGGTELAVPPYSILVTKNIDLGMRETELVTEIIRLKGITSISDQELIGSYFSGPVTFAGDTQLLDRTVGDYGDGSGVAWIAADGGPQPLSVKGDLEVDGTLYVNPEVIGENRLSNVFSGSGLSSQASRENVVISKSGFAPFKKNPFEGLDVEKEVKRKIQLSKTTEGQEAVASYDYAKKEPPSVVAVSFFEADEKKTEYENVEVIAAKDGKKTLVADKNLVIEEDLRLEDGVKLYVEGDVTIKGSVTGRGSIYSTGTITVEGTADLTGSSEKVALMSGEDIVLEGRDKITLSPDIQEGVEMLKEHQTVVVDALETARGELDKLNSSSGGPGGLNVAGTVYTNPSSAAKKVVASASGMGLNVENFTLTASVPTLTQDSVLVGGGGIGVSTNGCSKNRDTAVAGDATIRVMEHESSVTVVPSPLDNLYDTNVPTTYGEVATNQVALAGQVIQNLPDSLGESEKEDVTGQLGRAVDYYQDIDLLGGDKLQVVEESGVVEISGADEVKETLEEKLEHSGLPQEMEVEKVAGSLQGIAKIQAEKKPVCRNTFGTFLQEIIPGESNKNYRDKLVDIVDIGRDSSGGGDLHQLNYAVLILGLEYPDSSTPYLLNSLLEELGRSDSTRLSALIDFYGKKRFRAFLNAAIAQAKDVDFEFLGRTSFSGLVYAKRNIVSKGSIHIDGVVIAGGKSTFGDGTLFSLSPESLMVTQNPEFLEFETMVYFPEGL